MSQQQWPERFSELKKKITAGREQDLTDSWARLLVALKERTEQFVQGGSSLIPEVQFSDLPTLNVEQIADIKRKGCVVIRNVVPSDVALGWKAHLKQIVEDNPSIYGIPENDKQLFYLYWSKPQVAARGHPHVLSASAWLNGLFTSSNPDLVSSLTSPLSYPDRFRIRKPGAAGSGWAFHPPHVDGGSIERWEDPGFRTVFKDILSGEWEKHDAFDMDGRINAQANLYDREGQATVWRSFQGWLSMSDTSPGEGTLRLFPDVQLANAYLILRPFFEPVNAAGDLWDPANWKFDTSSPEFAGIRLLENGRYWGPRVSDSVHPNLRTSTSMVTIPKVAPGDFVGWHGDLIHSVEENHAGVGDSSVMYIAAVPSTEANARRVKQQTDAFLIGAVPPDYGKDKSERDITGVATEADLTTPESRRAMCLPVGA